MLAKPIQALESWWDAALGLFYPRVCQLCGLRRAARADGFVCQHCRMEVCWIKPPFCRTCGLPFEGEITASFRCAHCQDLDLQFDWARASTVARGPVLEAIHRYKYRRQLWFEEFLAALLLAEAVPALNAADWDWLIPVPLHPVKEREREFNQAERMARRLSKAAGIPLETRLLRRVRATRTQTLLTRSERMENMRQAFALRPSVSLKGRRCLLVDDVFTTGSTTSACAQVLRQAGAATVAVWTVARGV
jgi:competence protein ComFC